MSTSTTHQGLDAQKLSDYMAKYLGQAYAAAGYGAMPAAGGADRKMFFDSIALAVVEHLKNDVKVVGFADNPQSPGGSSRLTIEEGTLS